MEHPAVLVGLELVYKNKRLIYSGELQFGIHAWSSELWPTFFCSFGLSCLLNFQQGMNISRLVHKYSQE